MLKFLRKSRFALASSTCSGASLSCGCIKIAAGFYAFDEIIRAIDVIKKKWRILMPITSDYRWWD